MTKPDYRGKVNSQHINKLIEKLNNNQLTEEDVMKPNGYADRIAKELSRSLKMSQLRKIFGKVKKMEKEIENNKPYKTTILELYPLLAYATGRDLIPSPFYDLMKNFLTKSESNVETAKLFVKFTTSLVAYHKFYNPKA